MRHMFDDVCFFDLRRIRSIVDDKRWSTQGTMSSSTQIVGDDADLVLLEAASTMTSASSSTSLVTPRDIALRLGAVSIDFDSNAAGARGRCRRDVVGTDLRVCVDRSQRRCRIWRLIGSLATASRSDSYSILRTRIVDACDIYVVAGNSSSSLAHIRLLNASTSTARVQCIERRATSLRRTRLASSISFASALSGASIAAPLSTRPRVRRCLGSCLLLTTTSSTR